MRGHDTDRTVDSARGKVTQSERLHPPAVSAALSSRWEATAPADLVELQRLAGNSATAGLIAGPRSPVHDVVASAGAPLPGDVRADMESRFGHDFGDVRVHDDAAAHDSAAAVNAQAYTVGSNIVFQRGSYDPGSHRGQHMIAHELTHVVQQRSGPVDGTDAGGGIRISDPSDRFEREAVANADRIMAVPGVQRATGGPRDDHTGVAKG
ncbi:DUF4157 domain-containing protein [Gordonia sp. PKS22-38]|uniref:DUF4157 domain-containing protein n=1 Tax=Gordonia prachuapensis TaxID=3115651 RepID=A0ABU7MRR3_9ACTN|nr:DUF4157 domain-containing protein [Gordonia sp. PKS22-38]